jgi:hypothetical protein
VTGAGDFPTPTRREPRCDFFPRHRDAAGQLLTGPQALAIARQNLADWIADHAGVPPIYCHPRDTDDAQ